MKKSPESLQNALQRGAQHNTSYSERKHFVLRLCAKKA
jgi:hypothetical protein